jgi:dTDP-4-dehydrorhamnose reductase
MQLDYKIVITGGSGRFGSILQKKYKSDKLLYPNKKELNILSTESIEKYLKKTKPKILIHLAGLSRPMKMHNDDIIKSIDLNIIGTGNVVKICSKLKIKLIYFSTSYVYQGKKGNYKETDPVLPFNNYAWSKMGGECSVQMYKNSLILRCCMTEKPFVHKSALANVKANFIFQDEIFDSLKLYQDINELDRFKFWQILCDLYSWKKKISRPKNSTFSPLDLCDNKKWRKMIENSKFRQGIQIEKRGENLKLDIKLNKNGFPFTPYAAIKTGKKISDSFGKFLGIGEPVGKGGINLKKSHFILQSPS